MDFGKPIQGFLDPIGSPVSCDAFGRREAADTDRHELGGRRLAYGLRSIPYLFFVDREGFVVDELNAFESAEPFLSRVERLIHIEQGS